MRPLYELIDRVNNHRRSLGQGDRTSNRQDLTASGESATQEVLSRIFSVPSDSERVVLLLNDADLKDRYLSNGGEKKIVDATTDEQIAAIFSLQLNGNAVNNDDAFLYKVDDFNLTALDKPLIAKRPYAVLFNVPRAQAAAFNTAPANAEEARKAMLDIISHKLYVATLNGAAIKKANVGPLDDRDEREEKFDIKKFITAFPMRAVINAARQEQEERGNTSNDARGDRENTTAPVQLSGSDRALAKQIAADARNIYFRASGARNNSPWPDSADRLKALRQKLVQALTKDPRIGDNKKIIPAIVRAFYNDQVRHDHHYNDLTAMLNSDADFVRLTDGGDIEGDTSTDSEPEDDSSPEPDENSSPNSDEPTPQEPDTSNETNSSSKTADELAADIQSRGDAYADEVAKILARRNAAQPEATSEPAEEMPEEIKKEIERLTKIKTNAINPAQRKKAATDLAALLHQQEKNKREKAKSKRR